MTEIKVHRPYAPDHVPVIPKPDKPVDPMIVTVQEGVPIAYPDCFGTAVRVVHPVNPNAPAKSLGLVMFYLPPWCLHGIENTGTEVLVVLIATAPPNP